MRWDLRRLAIGIVLLLAASASWWFLRNVEQPESRIRLTAKAQKQPDYYMENFRATVMDVDGEPAGSYRALDKAPFRAV
jgi:lipopolysaccharide export system protein LptC